MDPKIMTILEFASLGGKARAETLTAERRRAIALKGGIARAKKAGQKLRRKPRKAPNANIKIS